jgi:UDP-N-acetylglucosamine:LPS N-acetylglucosamine transferase
MKFCFFTFYYPPDLSAGSFRSIALVNALIEQMDKKSSLIVITTSPNRYKSYDVSSEFLTVKDNLKIYRVKLPKHSGSMLSQSLIFVIYFIKAIKICFNEKPDFLIGTSGRLMTAILTWVSSILIKKPYLIDLRDIFSESIADIFAKKNKIVGKFFNRFFSYFDKCVLTNAASVNVVSMGFPEYFNKKGIDTSKWLFYPNGVDDIFVNNKNIKSKSTSSKISILYAGNIGHAQALHKIVPFAAKKLGRYYNFLIIGDGSAIGALKSVIKEYNVKNIEIIKPVDRETLLEYYRKSDVLFLNLDNIPAFMRVLPSKLFEYAAIGKPIVAGIQGYSGDFSSKYIPYSLIFKPEQIDECVEKIIDSTRISVNKKEVDFFIDNFSRKSLMKSFASDILKIASEASISSKVV